MLPKIVAAWKQQGGQEVDFDFDASSRLAIRIENGAPIDLFFSADEEWMDDVQRRDLIDASSRIALLTNELVLVVPSSSESVLAQPRDLLAVRRVVLAGENVPAGRYARTALAKLGVWPALAERVVNGSNVRQALELAARGEVDAAIVYRTDAVVEPRVRQTFTFPADSHPRIVYPAASLKGAPEGARRFLAFCRTEAARRIFEQAGFGLAGR